MGLVKNDIGKIEISTLSFYRLKINIVWRLQIE